MFSIWFLDFKTVLITFGINSDNVSIIKPQTGEFLLNSNPFDNKYISPEGNMSENGQDTIEIKQAEIPTENYLQSYITKLSKESYFPSKIDSPLPLYFTDSLNITGTAHIIEFLNG